MPNARTDTHTRTHTHTHTHTHMYVSCFLTLLIELDYQEVKLICLISQCYGESAETHSKNCALTDGNTSEDGAEAHIKLHQKDDFVYAYATAEGSYSHWCNSNLISKLC